MAACKDPKGQSIGKQRLTSLTNATHEIVLAITQVVDHVRTFKMKPVLVTLEGKTDTANPESARAEHNAQVKQCYQQDALFACMKHAL